MFAASIQPVENKRGKRLLKVKISRTQRGAYRLVEGQGKLQGMLGAVVCEYTRPALSVGSDRDSATHLGCGAGWPGLSF